MKIEQVILPADYSAVNVVYIQQTNYPLNKDIVFTWFVYKDTIEVLNNPYVVAVFKVKRKTKAPIERAVRASMEVFAVN